MIFGAIPVYLFGHWNISDCRPVDDGQVCKAWFPAANVYWLAAVVVAYLVIAGGYLRVARARGLGARVLPYVLTGVALIVLFAAVPAAWIFFPRRRRALLPPSAFVQVLFRLLPLTGAIGLAISGGVPLLGSAGFALAQRLRRTP